MQSRLVWTGCLIVAGAAFALWLLGQRDSAVNVIEQAALTDTPSVRFTNVKMQINGMDGTPQYRLLASEYRVYEDEQRSEFDLPDITLYDSDGDQIHAHALRGETNNYTSVIVLTGDVRITRAKRDTSPHPLNITMDTLTVFPDEQRAHTDSAIKATLGSQMFSSLGMSLDLKTKVLLLHSNVESTYEP